MEFMNADKKAAKKHQGKPHEKKKEETKNEEESTFIWIIKRLGDRERGGNNLRAICVDE